jgi:serine/threonine-protein kinase
MSEVWLAKHAELGVPVILKTLRPSVGEERTRGFARILHEARLMARIPSPRVVRAIDAGVWYPGGGDADLETLRAQEGSVAFGTGTEVESHPRGAVTDPSELAPSAPQGTPYVVQEYVDGIDLAELDRERRRALGVGLPLWYVCHTIEEVALALQASHQTGVIHRDVKPSNVFGSPQTGIRLGDFGIAVQNERSRPPDEISGTFRFMAPEQLRGDVLGRACDVYGLGATACDLRYGRPPYDNVSAALDPNVAPRFPQAQSPSEAYFQHLLHEMLRTDPATRPHSLALLARHFRALETALRPRLPVVQIDRNRLQLGECSVRFEVGDIACARADGIVNSAHDHMRMRTGVGQALRVAGGDEIEDEALRGGHRALGACVATGAGKLDARWVLHAVSAWNEVSCVGRAAHRTLLLAEVLGLRSLAIPALGTGASRVTMETAADALATALKWHLMIGGSRLRHVTFVLRDETLLQVFREVALEALRDDDELPPAYDMGLQVEGGAVVADAATFLAASTPDDSR